MKIHCPQCNTKYQIDDNQAGMMFVCVQCQKKFKAIPPQNQDMQPCHEEDMPNLCNCPDCGKMISRRARWCPFCGCYDATSETPKEQKDCNNVFVKRINIPLNDAIILIVTFWVASAVILIFLGILASIILGI